MPTEAADRPQVKPMSETREGDTVAYIMHGREHQATVSGVRHEPDLRVVLKDFTILDAGFGFGDKWTVVGDSWPPA